MSVITDQGIGSYIQGRVRGQRFRPRGQGLELGLRHKIIAVEEVKGSGQTSLFLCVLRWWRTAGAFRELLGFGWPIRMQKKGKVTFALDGERLVGGEDVVPLPSWTDFFEGSCGQESRHRNEFFLAMS